ncbi:hypothetical protein, partial [Enterobacter hormaechei]|uniref:hypothetical protein n=1 Tax=Enterobacter hormaechei TaxID=158836 RepID=UPI003F426E4B
DYSCCCYFVSSRIRNPMVKKSLRQFTLMATATVTLLLGSVPLYAQVKLLHFFVTDFPDGC